MSTLLYDAHDATVVADRLSRKLSRASVWAHALTSSHDSSDWAAHALSRLDAAVDYARQSTVPTPAAARALAVYAGEVAIDLSHLPTDDAVGARKLTRLATDVRREVDALLYLAALVGREVRS